MLSSNGNFPEIKECPTCSGKGELEGLFCGMRISCKKCKGTGEIKKYSCIEIYSSNTNNNGRIIYFYPQTNTN